MINDRKKPKAPSKIVKDVAVLIIDTICAYDVSMMHTKIFALGSDDLMYTWDRKNVQWVLANGAIG